MLRKATGRKLPLRAESRLFCLLALAASLWPVAAGAGVQRFTPFGPEVGTLRLLAADAHRPSTIYAVGGSSQDLYKSEDGGISWRFTGPNRGLAVDQFQSVVSDPDRPGELWAAGSGTLYHSPDSGDSWTFVSRAPGVGSSSRLLLAPGRSPVLFFLSPERLVRSRDRGRTWQVIYQAVDGYLGGLVVDPVRPETLYLGLPSSPSGIQKSTDGGSSWAALQPAVTPGRLEPLGAAATTPVTLYASHWSGLHQSRDGGSTWQLTALPEPVAVASIATDPRARGTIYLIGWDTILQSTNGGVSWVVRRLDLGESLRVLAFAVGADHRVYLSTDAGQVLRASRDASRWLPGSSRGLTEAVATRLWIDPRDADSLYLKNYFWSVYNSEYTLETQVSRDRGRTWQPWATSLGANGQEILDLDFAPGRLTASTTSGVYASSDRGATWDLVLDQPIWSPSSGPLARAEGGALLVGGCGIARSADEGSSWAETFSCMVPGEFPDDPEYASYRYVQALAVDPFRPSRVFASIYQLTGPTRPDIVRYQVRSRDGGRTWQRLDNGVYGPLTFHPARPGIVYVWNQGLLRSTDGGETWQRYSRSFETSGQTRLAVDPFRPDVLYAATEYLGLLRSTDGGRTFTPFSAGLARSARMSLSDVAVHPTLPGWIYVLPWRGGLFGGKF